MVKGIFYYEYLKLQIGTMNPPEQWIYANKNEKKILKLYVHI
jgi:hypothetical protein